MAHIRKEQGQSGVGQYWWAENGDVVEVHEPWLVEDLLRHPGFSDVSPTGHEDTPEPAAEEPAESPVGATEDVPPSESMPAIESPMANILAWVGTDRTRADMALQAEEARGFQSRPTLIAALEKISVP